MADEQADESPQHDDDNVIERYGPGPNDVVIWDTTSNYARIRELRKQGVLVPDIAAKLDIKPSTVRQALTNMIKLESADITEDQMGVILQLEMDRLDDLVRAHYFAAVQGDIDSGKMMLAITKQRREWLKWAKPEPDHDVGVINNVLVIGGNENEYLAGLANAAEQLRSQNRRMLTQASEVETDGES